MQSELAKRDSLPIMSMSDLDGIGKLLAQTEMFGTKNPAEGFVIAAMCHQDGISYRKWMEDYHFIKGRVSKRADAILADFIRSGGTIKIVRRNEDGAEIELSRNGSSYTSKITWRDCVNEPFVYNGKESDVVAALASGNTGSLKIKDKYSTPRSRMQMMWARTVSDGVRALAPDCCQGFYTPEEMEDVVVVDGAPALSVSAPAPSAPPAHKKEDRKSHSAVPVDAVVVEPTPSKEPKKKTDGTPEVANGGVIPPSIPQQESPSPGKVTPFDLVDADKKADKEDFSVCPMKGGMFGKHWSEMETGHLRLALTLENSEIGLGHRREINRIIAEREKENGCK